MFFGFDEMYDSPDVPDAFHPPTLLATTSWRRFAHGLWCSAAREGHPELGYKSIKYLSRITVTDTMKHIGDGRGLSLLTYGYSWYAGI